MRISRKATFIIAEVVTTALLITAAWIYLDGDRGYAWTSVPKMLEAFREAWIFDRFMSDIVPSLIRLIAGYAVAVIIGVGLGVLFGISRTARLMSQPIVSLLRSTPAVALIPLSIVLFGVETGQKVAIIAFVCCWPIVLNTADGIASLDRTMLLSARTYGVTGLQLVREVILPGISPRIFAGMRVSLSLAILLLVTSEMVAASSGIGFFVWQAQVKFSIPDMWAGIILLGLLGYGFNALFTVIERRVCRWDFERKGIRT